MDLQLTNAQFSNVNLNHSFSDSKPFEIFKKKETDSGRFTFSSFNQKGCLKIAAAGLSVIAGAAILYSTLKKKPVDASFPLTDKDPANYGPADTIYGPPNQDVRVIDLTGFKLDPVLNGTVNIIVPNPNEVCPNNHIQASFPIEQVKESVIDSKWCALLNQIVDYHADEDLSIASLARLLFMNFMSPLAFLIDHGNFVEADFSILGSGICCSFFTNTTTHPSLINFIDQARDDFVNLRAKTGTILFLHPSVSGKAFLIDIARAFSIISPRSKERSLTIVPTLVTGTISLSGFIYYCFSVSILSRQLFDVLRKDFEAFRRGSY
jgi:hypothetical protein